MPYAYPSIRFKRRTVPGADVRSTLRPARPGASWSGPRVTARVPLVRFADGSRTFGGPHRLHFKGTPGTPIPDEYYTSMRVSAPLTLTSTSGALATARIALNSLFDPLNTAGAKQPRFYDQLGSLWRRYTVYGAKIEVARTTYATSETSTTGGTVVVVATATGTNPVSNCNADQELPQSFRISTVATHGNAAMGSAYYKIPGIMGRPYGQYMGERNFSGTISADPTDICYGFINYQTLDETTTSSFVCQVTITFYCRWSDIIIPGVS